MLLDCSGGGDKKKNRTDSSEAVSVASSWLSPARVRAPPGIDDGLTFLPRGVESAQPDWLTGLLLKQGISTGLRQRRDARHRRHGWRSKGDEAKQAATARKDPDAFTHTISSSVGIMVLPRE